ncbi:23S rRNA (pseudouridine(1915)-N(3))-methyltransferase RlmH [Desulfurispira natronophila]|uniref:Ribosomal RNA large subunit methyltransferase H n=1 Tax=Desulfurispira natronophila TaxID=682562 RepID=A0A7W8DGB9_9BACT|nr:23S rRNA (pseudouridine(1915)-N(3))-methyltransferase RlmH [Desulfurispira natronophila]MBB5021078.1 23S rRNA (pseudouridine1915-N3)-methyltransferase [Desulfurispira natronophila]
MKYRIISVGKVRNRHFQTLIDDFESRIARLVPFESLQVADEKIRESSPPSRIREQESQRVLERIPADSGVVALDEGGQQMSSVALARWLQKQEPRWRSITFCVGGALGHGECLQQRADTTLSLSLLTFNHHLARLVTVEQIYRALSIQRGLPYHNE